MPGYLPGEITDHIITFIWDYQTLYSCALVCHNWLPASRYRLFRNVQFLQSPLAYVLFVARILRCDYMAPWLADIRILTFHEGGKEQGDERIVDPKLERGHRLVHEFAGHLPNLYHLNLAFLDWTRHSPHPSTYMLFSQFPAVRELYLGRCRFPSFKALRRALVALPSLTDLTLFYVDWPSTTPQEPATVHPHSQQLSLHTFRFWFEPNAEACASTLLSWLSHTGSRPSIRTIGYEGRSFAKHSEFLGLATFAIDMTIDIPNTEDFIQEGSLSQFTRLRILEFDEVLANQWAKIALMLDGLPSRLHQLTIRCDARSTLTVDPEGRIDGIEDEGLELFDPILERDNFKDLQLVSFDIRQKVAPPLEKQHGEAAILEAFGKKLPKLCSRRILQMDVVLWLDEDVTKFGAGF